MKAIVNNVPYENIQWDNGVMSFETDMTFSEIESAFIPGEEATITIYDGEQEIAKYFNKGISSITVSGNDPRTVSVNFDITQISANAETEIRATIEDTDGAIEELAAFVSDFSEIDIEALFEQLQSHQETISTWFSTASDLVDFMNRLREDNGILDQFDIRIKALEHEVGIVSIEMEETNDG
jgi:hypothetical protein